MTPLDRILGRSIPAAQPAARAVRGTPAKAHASPESAVTSRYTEIDAAREDQVLTRLARLTDRHGPWEAAARLFGGRP